MVKGFLTGTLVLILLTAFGIGNAFAQPGHRVNVIGPGPGVIVDFWWVPNEEEDPVYVGFDLTDENNVAHMPFEDGFEGWWDAQVISDWVYNDPPDGHFHSLEEVHDVWAILTMPPKK